MPGGISGRQWLKVIGWIIGGVILAALPLILLEVGRYFYDRAHPITAQANGAYDTATVQEELMGLTWWRVVNRLGHPANGPEPPGRGHRTWEYKDGYGSMFVEFIDGRVDRVVHSPRPAHAGSPEEEHHGAKARRP